MATGVEFVQEERPGGKGFEQSPIQHPFEVIGGPLRDGGPMRDRFRKVSRRQGDVHEGIGPLERVAVAAIARDRIVLGSYYVGYAFCPGDQRSEGDGSGHRIGTPVGGLVLVAPGSTGAAPTART